MVWIAGVDREWGIGYGGVRWRGNLHDMNAGNKSTDAAAFQLVKVNCCVLQTPKKCREGGGREGGWTALTHAQFQKFHGII